MLPSDLNPNHFANYPPQARSLAVAHLGVLRQLPLVFAPSLLTHWIEYDWMFPAETTSFNQELDTLSVLTPAQMSELFHSFSQLRLLPAQEKLDWVGQPARFVEQLSAYLWSTHQMDLFRAAATTYNNRVRSTVLAAALPMNRLGIAIIGQGVSSTDRKLFSNLRQHGTYFNRIDAGNGVDLLIDHVAARAKAHPASYAHWYVDGGTAAEHSPLLTSVSYDALAPTRNKLLADIEQEVKKPGMGPEELHSHLSSISPATVGLNDDKILDRFQIKLLTEGSGTQVFSTTFAQWTAREVLRRAEPLTLLVRFAPRQRDRPMSELLSSSPVPLELDAAGSLVDADMGAYYHWINQQRLPGSENSSFVVWFEGQNQAVAIGPTLPRGTVSSSSLTLSALCSLTA